MRSALIPVLMPTGLPRRGLIAWHDLYDPTSSLASVPDLSGNGYSLQLGSDAGADTNDPSWGAGGKGLVHSTDDMASTPQLPMMSGNGPWTIVFVAKLSATGNYHTPISMVKIGGVSWSRVYVTSSSGGGSLDIQSYDGSGSYATTGLVVPKTSVICLVLSAVPGGGLTVVRCDTRATIGCAQKSLSGNYRVGVGANYGQDAGLLGIVNSQEDYSLLVYCRALGTSELTRAYRYLKNQWAARGVTIL